MANYTCNVRSNYFHIKDAEEARKVLALIKGTEDDVKVWEETDDAGNPIFAFGCYGGLTGIDEGLEEDYEPEEAYYQMVERLQSILVEDDAIIIMEVGNEKLRYLVGHASVITTHRIDEISLASAAIEMARNRLNNPNAQFRLDY